MAATSERILRPARPLPPAPSRPSRAPPLTPHALPPAPQDKSDIRKPVRATFNPALLPVPYYPYPLDGPLAPVAFLPRDVPLPLRWPSKSDPKLRGLSPADTAILRDAVAIGLIDPTVTYLGPLLPIQRGIYPGVYPPPPTAYAGGAVTRVLEDCPDAPMQGDMITGPLDDRFFVEIKPNAGYVALGQILTYWHAGTSLYGDVSPLKPAILTDLARPYMPGVCDDYGVTLFVLGYLLIEPPPWPT